MAKINIRLLWEIEPSDDCPPEVVHHLELTVARYVEQEEARVEQVIRDAGLGQYIRVGGE